MVAALALVLPVLIVGCQTLIQAGGPALAEKPAGAVRIATYNVHYIVLGKAEGAWSLSDWERRKGPLDLAVKALEADIVAFQEMESFLSGNDGSVNLARDWLLARNPGYAAAASGDWRRFPSTQPVFYRRDRFTVLAQGWFFFSETPDEIYSRTFDGGYPAFASWVRFRDRESGAVFRVVNVHFDYRSEENKRRSADLVAARIAPWTAAEETVFLAGDTNARLGASIHEPLEAAGLSFTPVAGATYHFNWGIGLFGAIDHLAHSSGARLAASPAVLRRRFAGEWPSDHYPVAADFFLTPEG